MPTKNERISLVNDDTEEVTAVQAPTPGLILESKMLALEEPFPIGDPDDADRATPPPLVPLSETAPAAGRATPPAGAISPPRGPFATTATTTPTARPAGLTTARPGTTTSWPATPANPAVAGMASLAPASATMTPLAAASVPTAPAAPSTTPTGPTAKASPAAVDPVSNPVSTPGSRLYARAGVDPTPVTSSGPFLTPRSDAWVAARPQTRRMGLYAALAALLVAGGGFLGLRQWWSSRAGHIEISTTPADAVIAVGGRVLRGHSPISLEEAPGSYTITFAREGYVRTDRTIELHAGQDVVLAIALAPVTGPPGRVAGDGAAGPESVLGGHAPGAAVLRHAATGGGSLAARAGGPSRAYAKVESGSSPAPAVQPAQPAQLPAPAPGEAAPPTIVLLEAREPAAPPTAAPAAIGAGPAQPESLPPAGATGVAAAAPKRNALGSADTSSVRTIPGRIAKAQLAIDPNADEYRVRLPPSLARAEMKLSAVVKLCVTSEGAVSDVKLLKSADPAVDAQIPAVLGKWRYRPLISGGQPMPFCYVLQYEIAAP